MNLPPTNTFENIYETLINESPIPISLYTGKEMVISMANDAMIRAYGRDRSVIGKPFGEVFPTFVEQGFLSILLKVFETGVPFSAEEEKVVIMIDGQLTTFYYSFEYKPLKDADGKVWGIMNTATDYTERVLSMRASERAEEMLRLAADSAEIGTWYVDSMSRMLQASPRTKELFGFSPDEDMSLENALNQIPLDHRQRVMDAIDAAITKGEGYDIEYTILGSRNNKLRWVRVTGKLYKDERNHTEFLAGTVLDITTRKESEQRKDEFISVASHELKTPLTSLNAGFQLLDRYFKTETNLNEKHTNILKSTKANLKKLNLLVEDLLNVTKIEKGQLKLNKQWFLVSDLVNQCCDHVRIQGKYELRLQGDLQARVYADEQKVDQVLVNFVNNAVKYAPDSKVIDILIESSPDYVTVSVQDFGMGIEKDKVQQIFNRFYQVETHSYQFSGLGLGLYISSQIIKQHGGEIGVESERGKGSKFWFSLPLAVTG